MPSRRHRPIARLLPFLWPVAYMGALYTLSSIPGDMESDALVPGQRIFVWTPPLVQNLLHIPVYAGLAWLWWRGLATRPIAPVLASAAAVVIAASYGVFDEWHQAAVPGRFASLTDGLLNLIGAVIGGTLPHKRWNRTGPAET